MSTRRSSSSRRRDKADPTQPAANGNDFEAAQVQHGHAAEPAPALPAAQPPSETQPGPAPRAPVTVGRSLEVSSPPDIVMEALVDKLKLLDYERDFCRRKRPHRKPLSRLYFALPDPAANQSQQFFYFAALTAWLLGLAGAEVATPKEFDDPNATCAALLGACKKLGFAAPGYHPSKLTVGHGREVCGVVEGLVDYVLERRNHTYRKPLYLLDKGPEKVQGEDAGGIPEGDMGDPALEFPLPKYLEEEEEEAYMGAAGLGSIAGLAPAPTAAGGRAGLVGPSAEERQMLQSKVDPTAWRLEVERVAPRLRILLSADTKDWRSHLEEVQQHAKSISAAWPDSRSALELLRAELDGSLDKLVTRERFLNDQFERLMQQYRAARTQLVTAQGAYNGRTEGVSDRNSELARITEQLTEMKGIMDEHSSNIADATPVVRMKNAIKKLCEELHEAEVRIGVVSHTLLQLSVKNKRALQAQAAAMSEEDDDS